MFDDDTALPHHNCSVLTSALRLNGVNAPHRLMKPCWPAHFLRSELWWTFAGTSRWALTMRMVGVRDLSLVEPFGDSGAGEGVGVGFWILMNGTMRCSVARDTGR
jgi:hypothetical protein